MKFQSLSLWTLVLVLFTIHIDLKADCPSGTAPSATAFALQPTCVGGLIMNNGYLQLSAVQNGDRVNYSLGSTYSGNTNYAAAVGIGTLPYQLVNGLGNPVGTQDYTIRVFNGASNCFTDYVVTMTEQDCQLGCGCSEYFYLNETGTEDAVHKYLVNPDGTFTETGNPWFSNTAAGESLTNPHGVTIDANGFVYIGENANGNEIRRFSCDGTIHPTTGAGGFVIDHNGQTNLGSIGTTLYSNHWDGGGLPDYDGITAYDLCDGSYIGEIDFCGVIGNANKDWGFYVDPYTGTMYSTTSFSINDTPNGIYVYDANDFDTDPNTCVDRIDLAGLPVMNAAVAGITTDPVGNIYIAVRDDLNIAGEPSYIMKFGPGPSYNFISSSAFDFAEDGTGWNKAIGIIYSEVTNLLFLSTTSRVDDCVIVFDTNLNPTGVAIPAPGNGQAGKGIAITKECCPTNNNQVIDYALCDVAAGDNFLLADLIGCDGAICESLWNPAGSNTDIVYNDCDNSITVNSTSACGSFILESDGASGNQACGAFKITLNISVASVTPPVIAGDQTVCVGEVPNALTVSTPATGSSVVSYQWQSSTVSCSTGFTDIAGATSVNYTAPAMTNVTTYYRLVASTVGCNSAMCEEISNCVNLAPMVCCPTDNCADISVTRN